MASINKGAAKNLFGTLTEPAAEPKHDEVVKNDVTEEKKDVVEDAKVEEKIEELPVLAVDDVTSFLDNDILTPPSRSQVLQHVVKEPKYVKQVIRFEPYQLQVSQDVPEKEQRVFFP